MEQVNLPISVDNAIPDHVLDFWLTYVFSIALWLFFFLFSDLNQIDENKNILHKSDEEEPASSLNVSDAFNRLVWIDPNSPTFQRKGVAQATTKDEHHDDADDEYEVGGDAEVERDENEIEGDWVEQDARMVHEQENRLESKDDK